MHVTFFRSRTFIAIALVVGCFTAGFGIGFAKALSEQKTPTSTIFTQKATSQTDIQKTSADSTTSKSIATPPPDLDKNLKITTSQVSADSKQLSFLLLGYGGAGHDGGYLSDTIILVHLDMVKQKAAFIHIPRDTWVTVHIGPTSLPMKINNALAMGTKTSNYPTTTVSSDNILRASTLTKQAVTTITGFPVDFVVSVDFNGFTTAINTLKGIDVLVASDFDDPWYPVRGRELELCGHTPEEVTQLSNSLSGFELEKQFPCRYEHLQFKAGKNHMDGETALKYGRSRHTSSDFARGRRQIAIIQAVIAKLFSLNALGSIPDFYKNLSRSVKTDITAAQITTLTPILKSIPKLQVVEIGLDTTNVLRDGKASTGAYILLPEQGEDIWSRVQGYISSKIQ